MEKSIIKIASLIPSKMAVKQSDGEHVYNEIISLLNNGKQVILDFEGIEILLSIFLNNAVGKLYGTPYKTALADGRVSIINMSKQDLDTLEIVKKRAIDFFANKGQ